jgi:hypothetical protein
MSITLHCDHCKKPITEVAYVLRTVAAVDPDRKITGDSHLHWDCVPHFGRSTERFEPR